MLVRHGHDDSIVKIKGTNAADNGMTWTAVHKLGGGSDETADKANVDGAASIINVNQAYVQVEGDFGKFNLVTLKTVLHKLCQALLAVTKTSKLRWSR